MKNGSQESSHSSGDRQAEPPPIGLLQKFHAPNGSRNGHDRKERRPGHCHLDPMARHEQGPNDESLR
jgi:hypothetical protein